MSGRTPSDDARILAGIMAGAAIGAIVGLVVFGGLLFVPLLLMLAGGAAGMWAVGGWEERRPAAGERRTAYPTPARQRRTRRATARRAPGPARAYSVPRNVEPVDVNTAGVEELTLLPGIGRAAAARIVAHREAHGPFASLHEIEDVDGFDGARVARLSVRATLSEPDGDRAALPEPVPAAGR